MKNNAQYKNKYINSQSAKRIERIRRIVTAITEVPKEAWVPFGFNCWQSSLSSQEEIFITGNSLRSALQKSAHYQLHKSCDSQTWYTFFCSNSYRFYMYTPDIPICYSVYKVHGLSMSWQFPLFFFEFADQPIIKTLKPPLQVLKNRQGTPNFWYRASFTRAETTSQR